VYLNNMCPRGTFGPGGGCAPCSPCPLGRFNNHSMQTSCTPCIAGRFGTAVGAYNTTAGCSGVCSPGFACPAGSTNATLLPCPAGKYSLAAAGACSDCSAGFYSSGPGARACTVCPLYTTSSIVGATVCLPVCPIVGQLSVT
jgi:hypothetical protein